MAYRLEYTDSSEFTGMLLNSIKVRGSSSPSTASGVSWPRPAPFRSPWCHLGGQQNNAGEENLLVSLNANHIDAYAIKSEPFQRTNLEFRPHKLKYPKPLVLQTNPTLFPVKNIPVVELDNDGIERKHENLKKKIDWCSGGWYNVFN